MSRLSVGVRRAYPARLVWFFARGDEVASIETVLEVETGTFILKINWPVGVQAIQRFQDDAAFDRRVREVESDLEGDRRTQVGPPRLLSADWWGPVRH